MPKHLVAVAAMLLVVAPAYADEQAGACVLTPESTEVAARALHVGEDGAPLVAGFTVDGIAVETARLVVTLRDTRDSEREGARLENARLEDARLVVLHASAPTPEGLRELFSDGTTRVLAAPEAAARLRSAAQALGEALRQLPWACGARGVSEGEARWLLPIALGVWLLFLAAVGLVSREAWRALRDANPALGGRALAWGLGILVLSGALRASLAIPWPLNPVEVQRALAAASPDVPLLALLVVPLRALSSDPVFIAAVSSAVLSSLAPLVAALTAALLFERPAGRVAGVGAGLILATSPLAIHFAAAGGGASLAAFSLLLALLATESLARRGTVASAIGAGLAWALCLHARPEMPAYLLVPALWLLMDPRLRRLARRASVLAPVLVLPALSLALDAALSASAPEPAYGVLPTEAAFWTHLPGHAWTLFLDPVHHPTLPLLLAAVGLSVARGRSRAPLALAGFVLPLLLASFAGGLEALQGSHPIVQSNLRYVVAGHAALTLLASAAVAWLWARGAAWRALGVTLTAMTLAGPLLATSALTTLSPLQLEHRFLVAHADRIPPDAAVVLMGAERGDLDVADQVGYRLGVARGYTKSNSVGIDDRSVLGLADVARGPDAARPLFYLRGWYEYLAEAEGEDPAAWRARLTADRRLTEIVCEERWTLPVPAHPEGRMELCLYRVRRGDKTPSE